MNITDTVVAHIMVKTGIPSSGSPNLFEGVTTLRNVRAVDCNNGGSIVATAGTIIPDFHNITVIGGSMEHAFFLPQFELSASHILVKHFQTNTLIQSGSGAKIQLSDITLFNVTSSGEFLFSLDDSISCALSDLVAVDVSVTSAATPLTNITGIYPFGNGKYSVSKTLYVIDSSSCGYEKNCTNDADCTLLSCRCDDTLKGNISIGQETIRCANNHIVNYGSLEVANSPNTVFAVPPATNVIVTQNFILPENATLLFQSPLTEPVMYVYGDLTILGPVNVSISSDEIDNGTVVIPLIEFDGGVNLGNYKLEIKGDTSFLACFNVESGVAWPPHSVSRIFFVKLVQNNATVNLPSGLTGICRGIQIVIGDDQGDLNLAEDLQVPDGVNLKVDGEFRFKNSSGRLVYNVSTSLGTGRLSLTNCNADSENGAIILDLSQTTITQETEITLVEFSSEACRSLFEKATISLLGAGTSCAEPQVDATSFSVLLSPSSGDGCGEEGDVGDGGDDAAGMIAGIVVGVLVLIFAIVVILIIITVVIVIAVRKGWQNESKSVVNL
eukprot:TRINITY_DN722_c0_g1_i1.p1 TRINITY_DN722_c0_g1~~TRINITY_DN722_c0_g1_i1.p1  ORF type:complete len:562 (-),score=72.00 TRINITY_DN722_c0_g1_i1:1520-3184(-)